MEIELEATVIAKSFPLLFLVIFPFILFFFFIFFFLFIIFLLIRDTDYDFNF